MRGADAGPHCPISGRGRVRQSSSPWCGSSGAACAISRRESQPVGLLLSRTYTTLERPLIITGFPPDPGVELIAEMTV